jgi:phage FluMu protein Com
MEMKIAVNCPKCNALLPLAIGKLEPGIEVECPICALVFRLRNVPATDVLVQYADEITVAADALKRAYIYAAQISESLRGIMIIAPTVKTGPKRHNVLTDEGFPRVKAQAKDQSALSEIEAGDKVDL